MKHMRLGGCCLGLLLYCVPNQPTQQETADLVVVLNPMIGADFTVNTYPCA